MRLSTLGVSAAADEGPGEPARPPKGKRTVISKYAKHACSQCRNAKARCEGGKPVCTRCKKTGNDCIWTTEDARRPLTRARAQALTHQNALLRAEVERLTTELATLRSGSSTNIPVDNHASSTSYSEVKHHVAEALSSLGADNSGPGSVWGLVPLDDVGEQANIVPDSSRPTDNVPEDNDVELQDSATVINDNEECDESELDADMSAYESDGEGDEGSDDDDVGAALGGGGRTLFTEQDDLYMYGPTSVFRLRRRGRRSHLGAGGEGGIGSGDDSLSSAPEYLPKAPRGRRAKRSRHAGVLMQTSDALSSPEPFRHVLLTHDADADVRPMCACFNDCWRRDLPIGVPLTRLEHDTLLDRFFYYFSSWCMRSIAEFFFRDMYTFLHPTSRPPQHHSRPASQRLAHYSPMLHNAILAVSTAFSSDGVVRAPETRAAFASAAKALLEQECAAPRVSTIQALGMLASYHSGRGEQTLGFMYFGMSVRIAQALGLGADCTKLLRTGRLRAAQVFDRAWAFHAGCAQDSCWSLYVGRECGIALPPPHPAHDEDKHSESRAKAKAGKVVGIGKATATICMDDPFCLIDIAAQDGIGDRLDNMDWRASGQSVQCGTFKTFIWSCQLMKISRQIMDLMNRLPDVDNMMEIKMLVADIDMRLDRWCQDLPAELRLTHHNKQATQPHKLMMHLAFWWQQILLHRPFYQRSANSRSVDSSLSIARCDSAAQSILNTVRLWRQLFGGVFYAPITMVQALFAAGTVFVLQATYAARSTSRRPSPRTISEARESAWELVAALRELAGAWECSKRIADSFERLLKEEERRSQAVSSEKADKEKDKGRSGTESRSRADAKRRKVNVGRIETASDAPVPTSASSPPNKPILDKATPDSITRQFHAPPLSSGSIAIPVSISRSLSQVHTHPFRDRPTHPSVTQVLLSPTISSDADRAYYSDIGSATFNSDIFGFGNSGGEASRRPHFPPTSAFSFSSSGSFPSSSSPSTSAWTSYRGNTGLGYLSDESYASDSALGTMRTDGACPSRTNLNFSEFEAINSGQNPFSLSSGLLDLELDSDLRALCGLDEPISPNPGPAPAPAGANMVMSTSFGTNMDVTMPGMGLYNPSGLAVPHIGTVKPVGQNGPDSSPQLERGPSSMTGSPSASFFDSFSFLTTSGGSIDPFQNSDYDMISKSTILEGTVSSDVDEQAVIESLFQGTR